MWGFAGQLLETVRPARSHAGIVERMDVEVVQSLAQHHFARAGFRDLAGTEEEFPIGPRLDHGVEHEPHQFVEVQPPQEVFRALIRREPWILERVEAAIAVEVAKDHAVEGGGPHPVHLRFRH